MELMIRLQKRKKVIYKITVFFFTIILLLTYFSNTINNALLPKVTTVQSLKGSLGERYESQGIIEYKNKAKSISMSSWIINKLYVDMNQTVKKGDILAQVEDDAITIQERKEKLEITKLENQIKMLKSAGEQDKYLIKEKKDELEIRKLEYSAVRKGLTKEGNIVADEDGKVISINIEQGSITQPSQVLFEIVNIKAQYCISWKLNSEDATKYNVGDKINIAVNIRKSKEDDQSLSSTNDMIIRTQVASKQYLSQENVYKLSANIDTKDVDFEEGQIAKISIDKTSPSYNYTIPKRCLTEESGKDYIFVVKKRKGLLGDEMFVTKMEVTLIDSNNYNCAINMPVGDFKDIVIEASRPLSDGMAVRVR